MVDLGQYTMRDVKKALGPRKGKGMKCAKCGRTLKGNEKLYIGGLCGKCLDNIGKR